MLKHIRRNFGRWYFDRMGCITNIWRIGKQASAIFNEKNQYSFEFFLQFTGFGRPAKIKHHTERGESHGRYEDSTGDYGPRTHIAVGQHRTWSNQYEILENARIHIGWLKNFVRMWQHSNNVFLRLGFFSLFKWKKIEKIYTITVEQKYSNNTNYIE